MKKMIGIDLDGTLLTPDKKITMETKRAVEEAIRNGTTIVPVTGRPFAGLPQELYGLEGIRYVIASNGAVTYQIPSGEELRRYGMPCTACREIYEMVAGFHPIFEIFQNGYGYVDGDSYRRLMEYYADSTPVRKYLLQSRKRIPSMAGFFKDGKSGMEGISVLFGTEGDCALAKSMLKAVGDIRVVDTSEKGFEINHIHADKGEAFLALAAYLGILAEDTAAIGDGNNDCSLLQSAGFSVAMGNAVERIRDIADAITADNAHDGAARAIRMM